MLFFYAQKLLGSQEQDLKGESEAVLDLMYGAPLAQCSLSDTDTALGLDGKQQGEILICLGTLYNACRVKF